MANLSLTPANIQETAATSTNTTKAGAAVTAGEVLYTDAVLGSPTVNQVLLAGASTSAKSKCKGIAVNNAAPGQRVSYATGGTLDMGVTLVKGKTYVVSHTDGYICPKDDLTTGDYLFELGISLDGSTILTLDLKDRGITMP